MFYFPQFTFCRFLAICKTEKTEIILPSQTPRTFDIYILHFTDFLTGYVTHYIFYILHFTDFPQGTEHTLHFTL